MTDKKSYPVPPKLNQIVEEAFELHIKKDKSHVGFINSKSQGNKLNRNDLATFYGVSGNTVDGWRKKGLEVAEKKGKQVFFDTAYVTRWLIKNETHKLQDELDQVGQHKLKMSPFQAKARKEIAGALMAELELAKAREQVANIEDLVEAFSDALVRVRAKIVGQSSRLSGKLILQEQEDIIKILDKDAEDMLQELSDYD